MSKKLLFVGSGLFILFVLFSYLVGKNIFIQFDFDTTVRLQDNISRRFDEPFSFLSEIGSFEPVLIFLAALVAVLFIKGKRLGFIAVFFFGFLHIIELYGKFFVDHLPPPQFMLRVKDLVDFPQFHVRSEFSYPSGHSARAAFLTILLAVIVSRSKKLSYTQKLIIITVLALYDILMFISRIYLGEHWASDVIGGGLLGLALGLLSTILI